jgi:hypothetical protein
MKKYLILFLLLINGNIYSQIDVSMTKKVKYSETKNLFKQLENNQLEFNFFGLSKTNSDCIYFVFENDTFSIEFEVMIEEQKKIAEDFKKVCSNLGFNVIETTYFNKPYYNDTLNAPVFKIIVGDKLDKVYEIGLKIISNVFGYNEDTIFEVVP